MIGTIISALVVGLIIGAWLGLSCRASRTSAFS